MNSELYFDYVFKLIQCRNTAQVEFVINELKSELNISSELYLSQLNKMINKLLFGDRDYAEYACNDIIDYLISVKEG